MFEEFDGGQATAVQTPLAERDGTNPIERKAVYRAQLEMPSMPASLVVQIALWPDKLADWAKESGISPAVVYNMLAGVKPYHRVRSLLARRLNVPKRELDYLVDAPRPQPLAKVPPDPPAAFQETSPTAIVLPPGPRSLPAGEKQPAAEADPEPGTGLTKHTGRRRRSAPTRPASQIAFNL